MKPTAPAGVLVNDDRPLPTMLGIGIWTGHMDGKVRGHGRPQLGPYAGWYGWYGIVGAARVVTVVGMVGVMGYGGY